MDSKWHEGYQYNLSQNYLLSNEGISINKQTIYDL